MFGSARFGLAAQVAQIVAIVAFFPPLASPARADEASAWDKSMHSAVRLIAAGALHEGHKEKLRAGIEIRLDKGWKTYWRYPGDSGVPPRFDFTRSENVKTVMVKWPAPHRYADDDGQSIGYKDAVILPLSIEPAEAGKPVRLRLDLDYAICERLCVPAEGKAELVLSSGRTSYDAALAAAEARVPRPGKLGENSALAIRAVQRDPDGRVVVDLVVPKDADAQTDLFAEGPTPEWALPLPEPVPEAPPGIRRFAFALDGLPPGAKAAGAVLTLTAVAGESAIEVVYRLD